MAKKIVKPTNFYKLKKECELITRVALSGKESSNNSWLINNIFEVKRAVTMLQVVAREYRKDWKKEELKTDWYLSERIDKSKGLDKSMCFYQQFKDLSSKNYLSTIRVASRKMANKCMKCYRDTGAECASRYYSMFRALEKQIHRLDTTLGKKVYELHNKVELQKEWWSKRPTIKKIDYKGKVTYFMKREDGTYARMNKKEAKRIMMMGYWRPIIKPR